MMNKNLEKNIKVIQDNFMDRIKDSFKFISLDKPTIILIIFLCIIFISVLIFIYYKYLSKYNKKHALNKEFVNTKYTGDDVVIIYFYTEWCPYCKKATIEWNKFQKYIDNIKNSIDYNITLTKIDCDKDVKIAEKYNIEQYPTIKLLYKSNVYDYDAKPTKEHLIEFLNSTV